MNESAMQDLLSLERTLWTGGPEAYRENLDRECLLAFTEMAGVSSREAVANQVNGSPRWKELEMEVEGVMRPTEHVTILTYRASAVRGDGNRYHALASSGYVRREGAWKLMFHQQTPLSAEAGAGTDGGTDVELLDPHDPSTIVRNEFHP